MQGVISSYFDKGNDPMGGLGLPNPNEHQGSGSAAHMVLNDYKTIIRIL